MQGGINRVILEVIRGIVDQGCGESGTTDYTGGYTIELNKAGLPSIRFEVYSYTQGAAHGLTVVKSLTFDLESGRVYELKDFFKRGSGYRKRISEIRLINSYYGFINRT